MPGYVKGAVAAGVLPNSLHRAFVEARGAVVRVSEYHDGRVQTSAVSNTARRTWRLTKRLTAAQLGALRSFWGSHIGKAFYFYPDPRQYDGTGVSTTGRVLVTFGAGWQESVGIGLSDAGVELVEVQAATGAGVTFPVA